MRQTLPGLSEVAQEWPALPPQYSFSDRPRGNCRTSVPNATTLRKCTGAPKGNFVTSLLKLALLPAEQRFSVASFFTPANWRHLDYWDADLGSAEPLLMPASGLVLGGSKDGWFYAVDRNAMGGLERNEGGVGFRAIGNHIAVSHIHGSPVTWRSASAGWLVYVWPENDVFRAFRIDRAGRYDRPPQVANSAFDGVRLAGA